MCKESIQLEIINKSEITKKNAPARSLLYRNPDEKHLLFNLALAGKLNLYVTVYKS